MKKIYLLLATLLLATMAMAYFYFTNLNKENSQNELALNAVTNQCALVFTYDNDKSFYEILGGQDLLQQALGPEKAKQLKNLGAYIQNQAVFSAVEGQKVYIGLNADNENVNFLVTIQLKPDFDATQILNAAEPINMKQKGDVYEINFADTSRIFLRIHKDLVMISNAETEVKSAAVEKEKNEFATFINENNRLVKNTLANLFVNFDRLPVILRSMINGKINGELHIFNQQKTYAALTYNFSKNKLLFNGTTVLKDQKNYHHLFVDLAAKPLKIDNIFPSSTANYVSYATSDYKKWQENLKQWFEANKEDEGVKRQISKIEQQYRVSLEQVFPKYFKDQFATFQLITGEKFGVIGLSNGEKVGQLLIDLSADYGPDIKIFKEPLLPFIYFGEPFKKFERPFYTIIDNYLVMANNASSIQSFLRSYRSNSLLINDPDYTEFRDQLSSDATICFYVNNKNSNDLFAKNLKSSIYNEYRLKSGFKSYNAFCYQLIGDRGKFLTNCLIYKRDEKPTEVSSNTIEN